MTITIELPENVENSLKENATAIGETPSNYASHVLTSYTEAIHAFIQNEQELKGSVTRQEITSAIKDGARDFEKMIQLNKHALDTIRHFQHSNVQNTLEHIKLMNEIQTNLFQETKLLSAIRAAQYSFGEFQAKYQAAQSALEEFQAKAQSEASRLQNEEAESRAAAAQAAFGMFAGRGGTVDEFLAERHAEGEAEFDKRQSEKAE